MDDRSPRRFSGTAGHGMFHMRHVNGKPKDLDDFSQEIPRQSQTTSPMLAAPGARCYAPTA